MTGPLELALDVSAVPARPGGAGYYTMALAHGLSRRDDVALTLVARRGDEERWREVAAGAAVHAAVPSSRPGRLAFEQIGLSSVLRSLGVQVHHGPALHHAGPVAGAAAPSRSTTAPSSTIPNGTCARRRPSSAAPSGGRRSRAGVLICVSQVTADRLRDCCEVRAPVVVAPHGVDHRRFSPREPAEGEDRALLGSLGVPAHAPLVVFVGTLEPRKGVAPLVAAFDEVAGADPDAVLVLGGQTGWGMAETERALAEARHPDRIVRTGYLPDRAVPALLRQASVVAYPALEEGFGLPALEALACGAPLVTTEGTAMAEVAGGAALLVPPGDVAALAGALRTALDEGRATERQARGIAVARGADLGGERGAARARLCGGPVGLAVGFRGCVR